ncbi:FAD-dependent oxidoreductase [Gammaproteobacteria bacterium]|nr:FAD-dependent oxidoreductase [Gammaproteobacteria bacterium]
MRIETDALIVGSGAAGLTAALTARSEGLETLIVEKTEKIGGTTAYSGGVMWVPNNHLMEQAGIEDSTLRAMDYLRSTVGNRVSEERLLSFVENAPKMLKKLTEEGYLEAEIFEGFPDYRAEVKGGVLGGRSVEPKVFSGRKLGEVFGSMRARKFSSPVVGTMTELRRLAVIKTNFLGALKSWKVFARAIFGKLFGSEYVSSGRALTAWLTFSAKKIGVGFRLNHRLIELIEKDGAVVGARVENHEGVPIDIFARNGVVLACGGFEHNTAMRAKYLGNHAAVDRSSGSEGNEGDAITSAKAIGAALDLMEDAWWAPTFMVPDVGPQIVIFERGKPGQIVVDQQGNRFANEAQPYNDFVKAMFDSLVVDDKMTSCFMVFDQNFRDRYPLATMMPGITPEKHLKNGFLRRGNSIEELAKAIGIEPANLLSTVERFNAMAVSGKDEDFGRGDFAFDRFSGDEIAKPNSCLAPLNRAPFYAIEMFAGDLGTKGGLLTDESARVINQEGKPIAGLYAVGNCSASAMGHFYPGAGGTIGPAMTFGFIAGMHVAR